MIKKYSLAIAGHATSISLEPEFWAELQLLAARQEKSLAGLIADIDQRRGPHNLSSALRLYVLTSLKEHRKTT